MVSWEHLVRQAIRELVPFAAPRDGLPKGPKYILLDSNENTYVEGQPNRYPHPQSPELIALFAGLYGAREEQIFISLGGDVGLDSLLRVFCEARQDAVMLTPPTYAMYKVWTGIQGVEAIEVPLTGDDYQLDVPGILAAWKPHCKMLFLCTPNNPLGNLMKRDDIRAICKGLRGKGLVVVEQVYQEFSSQENFTDDILAYDNLVILRTMSKVYGLAGARCGCVIGHPEMVRYLRKVMAPYPIPQPTVDVVLASTTPEKRKQRMRDVETVKAERQRMFEILRDLPDVVKIFPSEANFLFMIVRDIDAFLGKLRVYNILARDRRADMPHAVRLTIGTPEENDLVLKALGANQ